ncbi:MAG TPA: antibiotic biosynthesis monooxygenase [Vicinamibacterales bacterium]|nr:antibiotic biosynthesis monooxygenase [Vicinamibacterales bacterium]
MAKADRATDYIDHLRAETFPALEKLPGFVSASILRRAVPEGVEFLIVTEWQSLDAIRAFAGDDIETAVVPQAVQGMMIEFDRVARHFHVVG